MRTMVAFYVLLAGKGKGKPRTYGSVILFCSIECLCSVDPLMQLNICYMLLWTKEKTTNVYSFHVSIVGKKIVIFYQCFVDVMGDGGNNACNEEPEVPACFACAC